MNDTVKNILLWAVIALVLVAVLTKYMPAAGKPEEVRYSSFLNEVRDGRVMLQCGLMPTGIISNG